MWCYIGVVSVFLLFLCITGFFLNPDIGANCNPDTQSSWHWISLSVVDTLQAITIISLTLLFCQRQKQSRNTHQASSSIKLQVMGDDDAILKRLIGQSTLLAVFYTIWAVFQWGELLVMHWQIN